MLSNSLVQLDREHLIHPLSAYRQHERRGVRVLASAEGATLVDSEGHRLLDGFAGLWCVNVGYGHDSIVEAAAEQMRRLPYATGYFGLGSDPAIRLAAALADRAPGDLNHVFFTLGGSDAVDSTVRFIKRYNHALGRPEKDQFISLEQGFHGSSTVGAGLTALPGLPCRVRRSLRLAAQDSVALRLPQSRRRGSPGDHRSLARPAACEGRGHRPGAGRGLLRGADPGFRRRAGPARRVAEGNGRRLPLARHIVRRRRGHHRFRPHGSAVRVRPRTASSRT